MTECNIIPIRFLRSNESFFSEVMNFDKTLLKILGVENQRSVSKSSSSAFPVARHLFLMTYSKFIKFSDFLEIDLSDPKN
jgi:hypothetical protein